MITSLEDVRLRVQIARSRAGQAAAAGGRAGYMDEIERRVAALERAVIALAGFVPPTQREAVIELLEAEARVQHGDDGMVMQGAAELLALGVTWSTPEGSGS